MKAIERNRLSPVTDIFTSQSGKALDHAAPSRETCIEPNRNLDHTFQKKFLVAVSLTAGAFGWTSWNLMHSPQLQSPPSLVIGSGLLVLCFAAWVATIRSLFKCRRVFLGSAEALKTNESLAQERDLLRAIIDHLPDCIYAKDRKGRFVLNNPAHAKHIGASSSRGMKGKSDFDFFPMELASQFYADEQKIIETGRPVINQEQYKAVHTDPSAGKRWSLTSKVLWHDKQGHLLGTVGITRDIHEFKLMQEALRKSEAKLRQFTLELERSNRELQDFAYVASHDLQEPLRKIVVFSERLREKSSDNLGAEACDYLERMSKAAARMQNLINDLLTFSRVTTKAQPFKPVDLAHVAREVVSDLEGRIEQVKGRVELGTLPVIQAEELQMRQLLQNLIGNALKFHRPEESPVVKVEAQIVSGLLPQAGSGGLDQELCRLTVSDNGIGFDEKYLDRIFNVFQRLHSRNEYEGTGMGLAIARKIVQFHRGEITAQSKPGHGAAFIVTLPVVHSK
jgi:PAS domain S-box-containing protein